MDFSVVLWLAIVGYVVGSIPSSVVLSKFLGYKDPRQQGSGNIGFSNVMRTSDSKIFPILVLVTDVSKGLLACIGGGIFDYAAVCGAACLFGNLYALWPKGSGKGVSVLMGILLYLSLMNIVLMPLWLILSKITYPVVGSMVIIGFFLYQITVIPEFLMFLPFIALMIYKHQDNFKRLWNKTENKF